jgi:uncharacterized membrane-anchored protein YjiN (DUF445 family)
MRRWATAMLVVVSALWLVLVLADPSGTWAGYARAGLEASMVGALADWFAVVALFRRPLGLPIPHTAVVVERKDQFGRTLAEFFRENFVSGPAVAERVRASNTVARVGAWGAERANAETVARHVMRNAGQLVEHAGDDAARVVVTEARRLANATPVAGLVAGAMRALSTAAALDDAVDRGIDIARRALDEHRDDLADHFLRERPWWLPDTAQRRIFDLLVERVDDSLAEVRADAAHPMREQLRTQLDALADRIERDPVLRERIEAWKASVVSDERVGEALTTFVESALGRLRAELREPGSPLEDRLADAVQDLARRVRDEPELRERIERAIDTAVTRATTFLGGDIDSLITGTIARWDADRTADQLELLLGPDLQYIRINGTVVGGLAGLLIHAIGQAVR